MDANSIRDPFFDFPYADIVDFSNFFQGSNSCIVFTFNIRQFRPENTFFYCIQDFDGLFCPSMRMRVCLTNATKVTNYTGIRPKIVQKSGE